MGVVMKAKRIGSISGPGRYPICIDPEFGFSWPTTGIIVPQP